MVMDIRVEMEQMPYSRELRLYGLCECTIKRFQTNISDIISKSLPMTKLGFNNVMIFSLFYAF